MGGRSCVQLDSERTSKVEFIAVDRIVRLPSESDIEKLVSSVWKSTARENFDDVRRRISFETWNFVDATRFESREDSSKIRLYRDEYANDLLTDKRSTEYLCVWKCKPLSERIYR